MKTLAGLTTAAQPAFLVDPLQVFLPALLREQDDPWRAILVLCSQP